MTRKTLFCFAKCLTVPSNIFPHSHGAMLFSTRILAGAWGGIFAVFFFHIRRSRVDVDPWIWIVVGDIPPSYLPLSDCESPREVFRTYIHGMSRWVEFARKGETGAPSPWDVPPVDLPPTPEWAERLNQKISGLTLAVKPFFEEESSTPS
jgi:hypothetical protein